MNYLDKEILEKANEEAIYNLYLYLTHKLAPLENESLQTITQNLEQAYRDKPYDWDKKAIRRLLLLKNALISNATLSLSQIGSLTYSKGGLTACIFTKPDGSISVVFKGTGSGEWIDNGEGLSGIINYVCYNYIKVIGYFPDFPFWYEAFLSNFLNKKNIVEANPI